MFGYLVDLKRTYMMGEELIPKSIGKRLIGRMAGFDC